MQTRYESVKENFGFFLFSTVRFFLLASSLASRRSFFFCCFVRLIFLEDNHVGPTLACPEINRSSRLALSPRHGSLRKPVFNLLFSSVLKLLYFLLLSYGLSGVEGNRRHPQPSPWFINSRKVPSQTSSPVHSLSTSLAGQKLSRNWFPRLRRLKTTHSLTEVAGGPRGPREFLPIIDFCARLMQNDGCRNWNRPSITVECNQPNICDV